MSAIIKPITSREDLSFTCRDGEGRFLNWHVPHDHNAQWGEGKKIGAGMFDEVEALATVDEMEAFHAINFAMNTPGWQPYGWGIEGGFSDALAALAIVGMRAVRNGAERFDFQAEQRRRLEVEIAESVAFDKQARAAARKAGFIARKSRRKISADNRGGYMLVQAETNVVQAGERFDLSAADVIAYCGQTDRSSP